MLFSGHHWCHVCHQVEFLSSFRVALTRIVQEISGWNELTAACNPYPRPPALPQTSSLRPPLPSPPPGYRLSFHQTRAAWLGRLGTWASPSTDFTCHASCPGLTLVSLALIIFSFLTLFLFAYNPCLGFVQEESFRLDGRNSKLNRDILKVPEYNSPFSIQLVAVVSTMNLFIYLYLIYLYLSYHFSLSGLWYRCKCNGLSQH